MISESNHQSNDEAVCLAGHTWRMMKVNYIIILFMESCHLKTWRPSRWRRSNGRPCEEPFLHVHLIVQSVVLCCSDPYSNFHHDVSWLLQFSSCRSAKVPVAPARRCPLLCCQSCGRHARVYFRICVKITSPAFGCWTSSIRDHPVGVCITCGHSPTYMEGSVFQAVKT